MRSRKERLTFRSGLDLLEDRIALSSVAGVDDHGRHRRNDPAEVRMLRHGADDAANHDANDDRGGANEVRHGADDAANHDANDDRGTDGTHNHRQRRRHGGASHATRVSALRQGADDGANHNAQDDRGQHRGRGR